MEGLFKPLIAEPAKHVYRLVTDREYFTYCRLASTWWWVPRYRPHTVRIHQATLRVPDMTSFIYMYRDIFVNKLYAFPFVSSSPKILDLGANIGVSVLFFKLRYPDAEITAVESDPEVFKYLEKNILENNLRDTYLINKAVWNESTILDFYTEGADAGSLISGENRKKISVQSIDIRELLRDKQYDFVKMDIEGAERIVIPASREYLSTVRYIAVEYHSSQKQKQSFAEIATVLEECGFRLHIYPVRVSPTPLMHRRIQDGFDMQINIFGWQERI
jgi:FkbM family methyltransferase